MALTQRVSTVPRSREARPPLRAGLRLKPVALRRLTLGAALAAVALASPPAVTPAAAFELSTAYPGVAIGPGQTTTFALHVTSTRRERVELAVTQAPPGWGARLRGGGSQISAVTADPAKPPAVELEVRVPAEATPGADRIVVQGTTPSQTRVLPVDLNVAADVAGAAELTAEFSTLRDNASDTFSFNLTLRNSSAPAASFALAATGPEGWTVDARPSASAQATRRLSGAVLSR